MIQSSLLRCKAIGQLKGRHNLMTCHTEKLTLGHFRDQLRQVAATLHHLYNTTGLGEHVDMVQMESADLGSTEFTSTTVDGGDVVARGRRDGGQSVRVAVSTDGC